MTIFDNVVFSSTRNACAFPVLLQVLELLFVRAIIYSELGLTSAILYFIG